MIRGRRAWCPMTDSQIPAIGMTRQKAAIPGRSRRNAVTGKLKTALEAMVWDNLSLKDAAARAGLADASLRFAFRKPHVMAHYHAELAALRDNLRAKNIHRLDTIADESTSRRQWRNWLGICWVGTAISAFAKRPRS